MSFATQGPSDSLRNPARIARGSLLSSMSRFPERHAKGSVLASTLIPCIFRLGLTFFD